MTNEQKYKTTQETIADIVAEMLEFADAESQSIGRDVLRRRIQHFARRFEAAAKREVSELRKGISELLDALQTIYDEECTGYGTGEVYDKWRKVLEGEKDETK